MSASVLCSSCFKDEGLKLDSYQIGVESDEPCPYCKSTKGKKLCVSLAYELAHRFFVEGTVFRTEYGAAPVIQFNEYQKTNVNFTKTLLSDVKILEKVLGVGFFYYGPRLWMIGDVEPLMALESKKHRKKIIDDIVLKYPVKYLTCEHTFYRLRKNPEFVDSNLQYDSPPKGGSGRMDSERFPVLYGSQDIEVCVHECRVSIEDEVYVATLRPKRDLKLLDLTESILENVTEFKGLDIAIKMLFSAGNHSYITLREVAKGIKRVGFDGIIYPSYFSTLRVGNASQKFSSKFPSYTRNEPHLIPNIALFGRPIKSNKVQVKSINRLILDKVEYSLKFGPAKY